MTLKEKFHQWLRTEPFSLKDAVSIREAQCEKIADDYAIKFAEWGFKKRIDFFDSTEIGEMYTIDGFGSKYKMNELLEIFKKEKGL